MKDLYEIPNLDYLLNRRHSVCIYCKGNVENVRHFLEHNCGFKHDEWKTKDFLDLIWLHLDDLGYVHGSIADYGHNNKINVSVNNLLEQYQQIPEYKPINLKRVEEIKLR